ncbi:MAG: ricin-type beta-trefoil lectin domain protein, partial [Hyphomicrobiales bacterium]
MHSPFKTFVVVCGALMSVGAVHATNVEITLKNDLDGILNGYCLDIAGGNQNVDPANGLQAHTCYSYDGALGTDQIFDTERFADNILYMPEYDVCAVLPDTEAGSKVSLASCDGSVLQGFSFVENGTITPTTAPEMCLTAATETRFGRGSQHQIKDLTLE